MHSNIDTAISRRQIENNIRRRIIAIYIVLAYARYYHGRVPECADKNDPSLPCSFRTFRTLIEESKLYREPRSKRMRKNRLRRFFDEIKNRKTNTKLRNRTNVYSFTRRRSNVSACTLSKKSKGSNSKYFSLKITENGRISKCARFTSKLPYSSPDEVNTCAHSKHDEQTREIRVETPRGYISPMLRNELTKLWCWKFQIELNRSLIEGRNLTMIKSLVLVLVEKEGDRWSRIWRQAMILFETSGTPQSRCKFSKKIWRVKLLKFPTNEMKLLQPDEYKIL